MCTDTSNTWYVGDVVWIHTAQFLLPHTTCTCQTNLGSFHCSLYCVELQRAQWFSEKLGTGIALFQALSNLAINGERAEARSKDFCQTKKGQGRKLGDKIASAWQLRNTA